LNGPGSIRGGARKSHSVNAAGGRTPNEAVGAQSSPRSRRCCRSDERAAVRV